MLLSKWDLGIPDKWCVVGMDLIGPFPMTNSDNQYVCAMTCLYSKFVYARAVPDKSAQSVCKVLIEMCHLYGPPKELITDQDQEFTLQLNWSVFTEFGIKESVTSSNHHGPDDRTNQAIHIALTKSINDHQDDWDLHVPRIVYKMNTSYGSTTSTPFSIFFAREPVKLWSERNESTKTQIVNPPHKLLDAMANNTEDANCDSCSDLKVLPVLREEPLRLHPVKQEWNACDVQQESTAMQTSVDPKQESIDQPAEVDDGSDNTEETDASMPTNMQSSRMPSVCNTDVPRISKVMLIVPDEIHNSADTETVEQDTVKPESSEGSKLSIAPTETVQTSSGVNVFRCETCKKFFSQADDLQNHKLLHSSQKTFQCKICKKLVEQIYECKQHKRTCDGCGGKRFKCQVCDMSFVKSYQWVAHTKTHAGEDTYECPVCKQWFLEASDLSNHVQIHSAGEFECKECEKSFASEMTFTEHMDTHTCKNSEKIYQCEVCQATFTRLFNLTEHMHEHTGEKPYQCEACKKCYSTASYLAQHKCIAVGPMRYQCKVCDECFPRAYVLREHMKKHPEVRRKADEKRKCQCDICGQVLSTRAHLKSHTRIHTGEKPFQCTICGKRFARKNSLDLHARTHSQDRPFLCTTCGERFKQTSALRTHMLMHTGEKPYKCSLCDAAFRQSQKLKRHNLVHTGEKPYRCKACGRGFTQAVNMKRHVCKGWSEAMITRSNDNFL